MGKGFKIAVCLKPSLPTSTHRKLTGEAYRHAFRGCNEETIDTKIGFEKVRRVPVPLTYPEIKASLHLACAIKAKLVVISLTIC